MFINIINNRNKNISFQNNFNTDLNNIRDEFYSNIKTTISSNQGNNTLYLSDPLNLNQSKRKNSINNNKSEKKSQNNKINILEIKSLIPNNPKNYIQDKNIRKRKNQTQSSIWKSDSCFKTYLNKVPNISIIKKREKKENSERKLKCKIIYYNSSIESNYRKKKKSGVFPLNEKIITFSTIQESNKVNFINNIMKLYKNKNKEKLGTYDTKIRLKKKETNNKDEINSKILKGFSLLSGNKSAMKLLFRKKPIKIANKLNPITNSYGLILDDVSGKIGFMKDSMNLIYPKLSQAKYLFNGINKEIEINKKNRSLIQDYNFNQNKMKDNFLLYQIKKRKINQTIYSRYPISLNNRNNSDKILTAKMYSLRQKYQDTKI